MGAILFLLRRYLLPDRASLLGLALWISVGGVALGIVQLMLVLSVMSGFQKMLRDNYTHITSDVIVIPRHSRLKDPQFALDIASVKSVVAATPSGLGQGMILKDRGVGGVVLEGVDMASSGRVTPWRSIWTAKPLTDEQERNPYWLWMGAQLAAKLQVKPGDRVNVLLADEESKRIVPFVVTAITKFGIYDHDLRYAYIDLRVLEELFHRQDLEPMYKCRIKEGASSGDVADRIREKMGKIVTVKQWSDINQNVFLAVEHQKKMLFLVLEIIIALAAMNVVNLLMMSSYQRRRDVAILRAMGLRLRGVILFFVAQGAAVGMVGVVCGVAAGYLVCHLVERFQPALLSEQVYNTSRLPIRIEVTDVAIVCVVALILCVLFSLLPAIRAALMRPVKALRYE